jgi:hypothetical protein
MSQQLNGFMAGLMDWIEWWMGLWDEGSIVEWM